MNLSVRRVRQLRALLLRPDAGEAADAVAEAQLAVVQAVRVGDALALASPTLVRSRKVVPEGWRQ